MHFCRLFPFDICSICIGRILSCLLVVISLRISGRLLIFLFFMISLGQIRKDKNERLRILCHITRF